MPDTLTTLPAHLSRYVPDGHRLWFSPKANPDAGKPEQAPNPNATGGTNRRDWILCVCGNGTRVEGDPTVGDWLSAVNQCRISTHTAQHPSPPVNADGVEQVLRDAPPAPSPLPPPTPELAEAVTGTRGPGRPRKGS